MGEYVNRLLTGNEKIVFETRLSWFEYISFICAIFFGALCAGFIVSAQLMPSFLAVVLFILFAALCGVYPWLERKCSEYVITSRRVVVKTGIISRNVFEMRLQKIESVDLEQSILGRIFDFGTLIIHGTGDTAKRLPMLSQPVAFRHAIDQACEAARGSSPS